MNPTKRCLIEVLEVGCLVDEAVNDSDACLHFRVLKRFGRIIVELTELACQFQDIGTSEPEELRHFIIIGIRPREPMLGSTRCK